MKASLIAIAIASATLLAGCNRADSPTDRSDATYGTGAAGTGGGVNENAPATTTLETAPAPGAMPGTTTAPDGTLGTETMPRDGTLGTDPTLTPGTTGAPTGAGTGTSTTTPQNDIPDRTGTTTN